MVNNIRVIGYSPVHYGVEYFRESLESIKDVVDKFVVIYSDKPSYGHGTNVEYPETEMELFNIAMEVLGSKLVWNKQRFSQEGEHRSFIYNYTQGDQFDLVLAIDADEIYHTEELKKAIEVAAKGDKRYWGVNGYINFWKSFSYHCVDYFRPIRITNLHNDSGEGVVDFTVYHFSCAQSKKITDYKYEIHGHKAELRDNWLNGIYYAWTPQNQIKHLHPTSMDIWGEALPFDKNTLPESLKNHPNFNKEIIS